MDKKLIEFCESQLASNAAHQLPDEDAREYDYDYGYQEGYEWALTQVIEFVKQNTV